MIRNRPLMPRATALWLIENTPITFAQIADFCLMHISEVQALADANQEHITPCDPVISGQLTMKEIEKCIKDPNARLSLSDSKCDDIVRSYKNKGARYVPIARRQDKPDAICWLINEIPDITDIQIIKLIGTTKKTISEIRDNTYWNKKLKPRDPVLLGLCTQIELDLLRKSVIAQNDDEKESEV